MALASLRVRGASQGKLCHRLCRPLSKLLDALIKTVNLWYKQYKERYLIKIKVQNIDNVLQGVEDSKIRGAGKRAYKVCFKTSLQF